MDRIDDMRLLVEAVELGSLARGGRQVGLSPASASRRLKRLEEHTGRLLERTTRQLRLTDAGREYYRRAKDILARVDELERLVVDRVDEPGGTLRVLSRRSFGLVQIAPLLADFGRKHPAMSVELALTETPEPLLAESVDLLVRLGAPEEKSLVTCRLASGRRVLCASSDYLTSAPPLEQPRDLAHHACLTYRVAYERTEWRFQREGAPENILAAGPLESNSGEVLRCAAPLAEVSGSRCCPRGSWMPISRPGGWSSALRTGRPGRSATTRRSTRSTVEPAIRARIEALRAVHHFAHSRARVEPGRLAAEESDFLPPVIHPLVRRHSRTGEAALFVGSHVREVLDLELDEGLTLANALIEHATRPEFVHVHRWRPHDLIIWDNSAVIHRGRPWAETSEPRHMVRATVADDGYTTGALAAA